MENSSIEYKLVENKNQNMLYYIYFLFIHEKTRTQHSHTYICTHTRYNQSFNYILYIKGNRNDEH